MPGVVVNITDAPVGSGVAGDTGKVFLPGITERGSITRCELVRSMGEFRAKLGDRTAASALAYDQAAYFFSNGGSTILFGRAVGTTPVAATVTLIDGTSQPALTVKANSPGAWGNNLTVQVVAGSAGGLFVLKIAYNGQLVETTPDLADASAAIQWAQTKSQYVTISDPGAIADPAVVGATALTGGTYDPTHITNASWTAALARFTADLGPGQVTNGGNFNSTVQQAVADHATAFARFGLIDLQDSATAATVAGTVSSLAGEGLKHAAAFAPWVQMPGLTASTVRAVPPSIVAAAVMARNDGSAIPPNIDTAASDDNGQSDTATGLTQSYVQADLDTLAAANINPLIVADTKVRIFGNLTLANKDTYPAWTEVTAARLFMYVEASAKVIGGRYLRKTIDPDRKLINRFGAEIQEFLQTLRAGGQLYNDPADAVDVGPQVNTDQTIANRQLIANVEVQPSPTAETVVLNIAAEAI